MGIWERILTLFLSLTFVLSGNISVLASELGTQIILDNTTLEPEEFKYSVTIPISIALTTDIDNVSELDKNVEYTGRSSITIQGNGIKDGLTVSVKSVNASDSGDSVTLTTEDGASSTKGGTFKVGGISGITRYVVTQDDYDAITSTGLEIDVQIEGVHNADTISVYKGGLVYSISEKVDVVQELSEPGLYDGDNNLICTYEDLVELYDMQVDKTYSSTSCKTDVQAPYYVLTNNPELAAGSKLVLGNDLSFIGAYAFSGCNMLEYVKIPKSAATIYTCAFYNNIGLTHVKIPASINSIEASAFELCTSLETVTVPNSVTAIGDRVFYGCTNLHKAILGDGHSTAGAYLFADCSSLSEVRLSKNLESFSDSMFSGCVSLEGIPECSITTIGSNTFASCIGFEEIVIPSSVTTIGELAFAYCNEVKYIEIPDSVTKIECGAFNCCTGLTSIYLPNTITTITTGNGSGPFLGCQTGLAVYCGADSKPSKWGSQWIVQSYGVSLTNINWGVTREEYLNIIGR